MSLITAGTTIVHSDGTKIERTKSGVIIVHNETTIQAPPKPPKVFQGILPYGLSKEEIQQLEDWMRPGEMSDSGFLDEDEKLMDVVIRDRSTMDKLGITHEQIADKLSQIMNKAEAHRPEFDKEAIVGNGRFGVKLVGYMGHQECPFEQLPKYEDKVKVGTGSYDFTIRNISTNESILVSELLPHLIKYHHFFEGNTEYRLAPLRVIKVLEIQ